MSVSNCGAVESYTALLEPVCLNRKGCDACWEKFKNPPRYSLPWLKRYRAAEFCVMTMLAKASTEDNVLRAKRAQLKQHLDAEIRLVKEIHAACPHVVENQKYEEWTNEDTYGCMRGPMNQRIQCKGCGEILWRGTSK